MPITNATRAASHKARLQRKERKARLAKGSNSHDDDKTSGPIAATPAAYVSINKHVPDCAYVADEGGSLVQQAQSRLMWGHRMTCREPPFLETLMLYDRALDKAKPPKTKPLPPTEFEQRMRDIRMGRTPYPPAPSRRAAAHEQELRKLTKWDEEEDGGRPDWRGMSDREFLARMRLRSSPPVIPASLTKQSLGTPSTMSRRRKMKNRSRQERIADLQAALEKEST